MTIMLLEDQAVIAFELMEALKARGHAAKAFASIEDAELWLAENRPIAAIVDCILNDGDSTTLVLRLRHEDIPIIVYTGRDPSDLGLAFDGLKIFEKPSSTEALLQAVEDCVTPERP